MEEAQYNQRGLDPKIFQKKSDSLIELREQVGEHWENSEEWLLKTDNLVDTLIQGSNEQGNVLGNDPGAFGEIVFMIGSFIGETIKRLFDGRWQWNDQFKRWVVSYEASDGEQNDANVFRKVENRFANGMDDSIVYFYEMLKKGKPGVLASPAFLQK